MRELGGTQGNVLQTEKCQGVWGIPYLVFSGQTFSDSVPPPPTPHLFPCTYLEMGIFVDGGWDRSISSFCIVSW